MVEYDLGKGLPSPTSLREERERAADEVAQERSGATARPTGVLSPGFVHCVHPDHGEPVVFVAGEMLPAWVVDAWGRAIHAVDSDVWTIPEKGRLRR